MFKSDWLRLRLEPEFQPEFQLSSLPAIAVTITLHSM
jgi:hypothetical protein